MSNHYANSAIVIMEGRRTPTDFSRIERIEMDIEEASRCVADNLYKTKIFPSYERYSGHFCIEKVYEETESERLIHYKRQVAVKHGDNIPEVYSKSFKTLCDQWKEKKIVERIAD